MRQPILRVVVVAISFLAVLGASQLMSAPAAHAAPLYIECATTTETDNIFVSGTYNPTYYGANEWVVYYDLRRDVHDGTACEIQIVGRVFPSSGCWSGTIAVNATQLFPTYGDLQGAYGQVSTTTCSPSHAVYRGPWAGASSGTTYEISAYQLGGSAIAVTSFSL